MNKKGLQGLEPKSRRPHRSPRQAISRQWKEEVLALKRRRRRWGAKKLVAELKRRHADKEAVSESTVGRLLRAAGLTHDRRRAEPKKWSFGSVGQPAYCQHFKSGLGH